jgi:hypothetical protein
MDSNGNFIGVIQKNTTEGRIKLISNSNTINDTIQNKTAYYIFPKEMDYDKLQTYPPAGTELDYCAVLGYYFKNFFESKVIDINKTLIYLGFNSELFCEFPDNKKDYHMSEPNPTTNVAINFTNNSRVYNPSLRPWYKEGAKATGMNTFVSTYVFADGGQIGATLSKAFHDDKNTIYGVLAYDILPYNNITQKDVLISTLLFDNNADNYQYFLIDESKVEEGNYNEDAIVKDLASMIYTSSKNEEALIPEKERMIKEQFEIDTFEATNGREYSFVSYYFEGDKKYLFFSDIELLRMRRDETSSRESVNKVGFTGSSSTLEGELRDTISDLTLNFVLINILIGLVCIIISLIISIIASRYLADTIMDVIIDMCIRMKIALAGHVKIKRLQNEGQEVAFSETTSFIVNNQPTVVTSEFHQLFLKIENALKVIRLKGFFLKEENSRQYNHTALLKYEEILDLYRKAEDNIVSNQKIPRRQAMVMKAKYINAQRKCYNNMGCLNYALGDYAEAKE